MTEARLPPHALGKRSPAAERKRVLREHLKRQLRRGSDCMLQYDVSRALVSASADLAGVRYDEVTEGHVRWAFPSIALDPVDFHAADADPPVWLEDDKPVWCYAGGRYNVVSVGVGGHAYLSCWELDGKDYWVTGEGGMYPPVPTKLSSRVRRVKQFIRTNDVGAWDVDGNELKFDEDLHLLTGLPAAETREIRRQRLNFWKSR